MTLENTFHATDLPPEIVVYYQELHEFITDQVNQLRLIPHEKAIDAARHIKTMSHNTSLINMGYVLVEAERVATCFKRVVELLAMSSQGNKLAITLQEALAAGEFGPEYWQKDLSSVEKDLEQWAKQEDIDADSLLQLAYWAFSPFWRIAAEQYTDELQSVITNERPHCPICGKNADFAVLNDRENGRRYLACVSCNIQWPYKRMGCIFCGNSNYDQLGYILIEDLQGYQIYHCEMCKSYLKTFDQRAAAARLDNNLMLENVKTLFLDLLAIEKGYLPALGMNAKE